MMLTKGCSSIFLNPAAKPCMKSVVTQRTNPAIKALDKQARILRLTPVRASQEAKDSSAPSSPPPASSTQNEELIPDNEFSITKISYGSILTPTGLGLLVYGFGAFFNLLPGAEVSPFLLIYGFPISVLGFALAYAQLKPVPCKTTRAAYELRSTQMTDIQKQIREDVTRFRYGDELHLEEALDRLFKFGKGSGIPRSKCPKLQGIREEVIDGMYALVLEFQNSIEMEKWEERQGRIQSFFGPGVVAKLKEIEGGLEVQLVSDGSGEGRSGKEVKDALPPLLPGLKPRQQN